MQKEQAKFYLRYRILCKRQILHQDIEAFVFFIQKLSDPPVGGKNYGGDLSHALPRKATVKTFVFPPQTLVAWKEIGTKEAWTLSHQVGAFR